MRCQAQLGPGAAERITILPGEAEHFTAILEPDLPVNEAIARAMMARGHQGGVLVLRACVFRSLRFVIPTLSADSRFAAYYSETHEAPAPVRGEQVNATFGIREDQPFAHLHGSWVGADGRRRAGHLLPLETVLAEPARAECWAIKGACFTTRPDTETNFPLFTPERCRETRGPITGALVKIQPNEDFCTALEASCERLGWRAARLRGGVGSLVGAHFTQGPGFDTSPTEVFVQEGCVASQIIDAMPRASVAVLGTDHTGQIAEGCVLRADNAVLMTFELLLTRVEPEALARDMAAR